eukprot:COSAG04_NODE_132_length_24268_cov_7.633426_10_plen_175_part_00
MNTAAVGQAVLAKGGFAVPFFTLSGRNESSPEVSCQRDMQRMCNRNATTGRPDLVDQALLFEFSRVDHKADVGIWHPNGSLPYFEQDLATFMLVRGAHAWMGYTWSGCTDSGYPSGCGKRSSSLSSSSEEASQKLVAQTRIATAIPSRPTALASRAGTQSPARTTRTHIRPPST